MRTIAVVLTCLLLAGCMLSINGHDCPTGSRNMDCMLARGEF